MEFKFLVCIGPVCPLLYMKVKPNFFSFFFKLVIIRNWHFAGNTDVVVIYNFYFETVFDAVCMWQNSLQSFHCTPHSNGRDPLL